MKKHKKSIFNQLIVIIKKNIVIYPDIREVSNRTEYTFEEIIISAFALFFFQSPSWLGFQTKMQTLHPCRQISTFNNLARSHPSSAMPMN